MLTSARRIHFRHSFVIGFLLATAIRGAAWAADPATSPDDLPALKARLEGMERQNSTLQERVADLEKKENANWMTQQRADQIKAIVQDVLADAHKRSASTEDFSIGYKNGFFAQSDDQAFRIQANGLFDFRYSYARAQNASHIAGTPLGNNHISDLNGFSLNTAQIALSGNIYTHIIYKFMGNFGSTASLGATAGTFQINELWGGYSFSPEFNIRGGSIVIPMIPLRTLANNGGSEFPDLSDTAIPFAPGYGLGGDVYGARLEQRLSYDVWLGDGSNSQNLVDSTAPGSGRDNRLSAYTREQWVGAGKLSDFTDEPDTQNHQDPVWIVGAGAGYESQTTLQTTTSIAGLSTDRSPGFQNSRYVLTGNLYRAAADLRLKYQGFSVFTEGLYQQINGSGSVIANLHTNSVAEYGYFAQAGYFILPKWELAGRFGQLYTDDLPNRMDVYTLGINYYMFGENAKLQFAETYIPSEAAFTNSTGSVVNTQDLITELQFQLKF